MNNSLTVLAALSLAVLTSLAIAQTNSAPPTSSPPTSTPTPAPSTSPNPQTTNPSAPSSNAPSTMQQPSSPTSTNPNPRSSDTNAAQQGLTTSPPADFATLDRNHAGYLTRQDVTNDMWLSRNFARCDADANGQMSQSEYASCTKNR